MSIATTSTKETYQGNASIFDAYPISFKYLEPTHVKVYFDGVLQQRGAGADYVLLGDGTINTGFVTTNVAQPSTVVVTIVLDVPFDQPVELLETGILSADTLEEAFDRLNMQIRRVWRKAQNVLSYSTDEGGAGSTGTADTLLGFDSNGDLGEIPTADFEPAKGADDNFVTDAEKVVIGNISGINTGDQIVPVTGVDFDPVGTDNSTDVTLVGSANYISLVDQTLTANEITESDVNASINASLDLADTAIQSLAGIEAGDLASTGATVGQVLQSDGDTTCSFVDLVGGGNAQTANPLSQFAATTSAELAGVISDETGTGALVFATSPALITPDLGTPSAVDLTNAINYPETNGTVQAKGATFLNIEASNEGGTTGDARGEYSVDLQTNRNAADQVASGANSVLVGGFNNKATGSGSAIIGSQNCTATGNYSFVAGSTNTCSSARGFVGGGITNDITSTGLNNAVIGGSNNDITGTSGNGIIVGGQNNTVTAAYAGAVGGNGNSVSFEQASIVGGSGNTSSALATFVGGGQDNSATAQYAGVLGGVNNEASGNNSFVMGGYGNTSSGDRGVVMMGANSTASGDDSMAVGTTTTASHKGARMFGYGKFATPFASKANHEFGIQADNFRLAVGTPAVGDVLTCNNVDGSSSWAAPTGVSFASYSVADGSVTNDGRLQLTEDLDPSGIGTVSAGLITLGAGTYQITHYGEYYEDDSDGGDYWFIHTRHDGVNQNTFIANEDQTSTSPSTYYQDRCFTSIITSASSQTVDIYADETSIPSSLKYQNVKLSILKLA